MELTLNQSSLDCCRNVYTQTAIKEDAQEAVVPDTLPDIGELLSATGMALIRGKDVGEGRIRIEGNIPVRVLYRSEDGAETGCMEVTIPLYASFENPSIPEDGYCLAELSLVSLSTRILNPRKISVRAETAVTVSCWTKDSLRLCQPPEGETDGVQLLRRSACVSPVTAVTEKTFVLTDEFGLPDSQTATQILDQHTLIQPEEIRTAGNKLIVRGSVLSQLLCLTEEGTTGVEFSSQFSQVMEAEGLGKDAFPTVCLLLSGVYYELSQDGRNGTMELHLVLQAAVRSRLEADYIADAYSNSYPLEIGKARLEQPCVLSELTLSAMLREQLDPGAAVKEVLLVSLLPGAFQTDGGTVTVPLTALLHCLDGDGRLLTVERTVQARFHYELAPDQYLEPQNLAVREKQAVPGQGGIELRAQLELRVFVMGDCRIDCIDSVTYDGDAVMELSGEPSLTVLRAGSGDSLWDLAKRYHSTVELIEEINGLTELPQPWEKLIAIPIAR